MTKKQITIFITGIFVVGLFGLIAQGKISEDQKKAIDALTKDINLAPDFTLKDMDDNVYTLSELKGKVVLVNFWATWCGPCRMEIPEFNELHKKYSDEDLVILGISVSDTKKALKNFTKSYRVEYPLLYGSGKEIDKVSRAYGGIYSIPTTFLIGKTGEILRSYPGALLKGSPMHTQFLTDLNRAMAK
jgi:peroxiredoxin